MRTLTKSQQTKIKPWVLKLDEFKGCATVLDDVIAGKEYAKEATNLVQEQDGRWSPRGGRALYGKTITGETKILGSGTFVKADGTRELLAIASSGKAYKSQDGGAWTEVTGATFDTSANRYFFKQINNYLFICNAYDRLTRYNGSTLTRYTEISAPTGLAGTLGAGLSAGSYHNFYVVTALNDVGETVASNEIDKTTNKERDLWNKDSNEYIDLTWTAVSGATAYQIYYSDATGKEELLTSTTTNSFKDDGTYGANIYSVPPSENYTGAPKFSMIATSGSRIWGIAPRESRWRVYFSGTAQYMGVFSDAFGGGFIDLDPGSDETVSFVEHFRSGKGDTAATILMSSPNGGKSIWQITLVTTTAGTTTGIVPNPDKIVGSIGTNAPNAALLVGDTITMMSAYGISELSNKENVTNVLSTTQTSNNIRTSYLGLNFGLAEQFVAKEWKNFVLYSATEGEGDNDLIFVWDKDLQRWYWKWDFGVRQFVEYVDNDGKSHLLLVQNDSNQLAEYSEALTTDFGAPIKTSFLTGLIPVSEDLYDFVKVREVLLVLGRAKGTINFEILGIDKKKGLSLASNKQITDTLQVSEFWSGDLGEITLMDEEDAPITYNQSSVRKRVLVGKTLSSIQFHIYSNTSGTEYTILSIEAIGVYDPSRPPSSWN